MVSANETNSLYVMHSNTEIHRVAIENIINFCRNADKKSQSLAAEF